MPTQPIKPPKPPTEKAVEYSYINLQRNPEKYTGYKGEHANRVWGAIYGQQIFEDLHSPDTPPEKRVFYRWGGVGGWGGGG